MKIILAFVLLCLCSACASRPTVKIDRPPAAWEVGVARTKLPALRTPEIVKAYPVGRYSDTEFPDAMHERHTVYRREQSPNWNYLPDQPSELPLGPTVATSRPSPTYYVTADREQMNAQQRAYAAALKEQNRALEKRIEDLQKRDGTIQNLEGEIERLKQQLESLPSPNPEPDSDPSLPDDFSSLTPRAPEEIGADDPGKLSF